MFDLDVELELSEFQQIDLIYGYVLYCNYCCDRGILILSDKSSSCGYCELLRLNQFRLYPVKASMVLIFLRCSNTTLQIKKKKNCILA